jgi:hypothetical protein
MPCVSGGFWKPLRFFTWCDMQDFAGEQLHGAIRTLDKLLCEWGYEASQLVILYPSSVPRDQRTGMELELRDVESILRTIGLPTSGEAIQEFRTELINWALPEHAVIKPSDVVNRIDEIHRTIRREMRTVSFLYVPADRVKWFDAQPEEWKLARDRWPKITTDIKESATCYSFDRHAASIFHILLVAEFGVIEVARLLGVAGDKPGWGALGRLEAILKKSYPERSPIEQQHSKLLEQILPLMLAIRSSWRDKISHVENKLDWMDTDFSAQVAEEIISATRGFMRRLAVDLPNAANAKSETAQ